MSGPSATVDAPDAVDTTLVTHRRARGRRAKLTREGKAFVFVTVGVAFAAINTGNNLVYLMLSLMLSLILLSMVMSELVMERLAVERRLPRRAFAGTPAIMEFFVRNDRRLTPTFSLEIEDRIEGEEAGRGAYLLKLAPGEEAILQYDRVPLRRGIAPMRGYRLKTRYPFGLVEKSKAYDMPEDWLVYPTVSPVGEQWPAFHLLGEERTVDRSGVGSEFGQLRDYQLGDEARTIHWKRSAALGHVVVRERVREAAGLVQIVLDNLAPDGVVPGDAWHETFEKSVARAASLAKEALLRGAAVQVVAADGSSPLVEPGMTADAVWRYLALVGPVGAASVREKPRARRGVYVVDASAAAQPEGPAAT